MADVITFKSESTLWEMLAVVDVSEFDEPPGPISARPFNMRRYDLSDERIYQLAMDARFAGVLSGRTVVLPAVKEIAFQNKTTGEVLVFEYLGMEFAAWAPGWCFLKLGRLLRKERGGGALTPLQEVYRAVDVGKIYLEDGAPHTAMARLQEALNMLDLLGARPTDLDDDEEDDA